MSAFKPSSSTTPSMSTSFVEESDVVGDPSFFIFCTRSLGFKRARHEVFCVCNPSVRKNASFLWCDVHSCCPEQDVDG